MCGAAFACIADLVEQLEHLVLKVGRVRLVLVAGPDRLREHLQRGMNGMANVDGIQNQLRSMGATLTTFVPSLADTK